MRRVAGALIVLGSLAAGCSDGTTELESAATAVLVETGASNPTVALDGNTTYVAWVGTTNEEPNVYLAWANGAGEFSKPVRVNDRAGDAAPHAQAPAQVAAGPTGEVYVAWQNNTRLAGRRFPASDLRFARSSDGGRSFGPAIFVNDDAGGPPASHTFHDLVVASDGTIYVTWIDGRATGADDHASQPQQAAHHHPQAGETRPQIRIARSSDGGRSFEPSRVVAEGACPCCRTALALGPRGEVYVAWRMEFDGGVRDVVVARSLDGGVTFAEPRRVHRDDWVIDACPHAGPALGVDRSGRVHVAWFTGAEGRAGAYYATSATGEQFSEPVALTPVGDTPTTQVQLATGEAAVWVTWEDALDATVTLRLARGAADAKLQHVSLSAAAGQLPAVAASGDQVVVAWLDGEAVRVLRGTDASH